MAGAVIWPIAALAALAAAPFLREAAKPRIANARTDAPGDFVQLSRGITHYHWRGPTDGPVVVCVHGLTTPSRVWDAIADDLIAQGFRVLVYDLYGRGYSDRPIGRQDSAFFLDQLEELLAHLNLHDDITLLGYSMGGAIATRFAARHARMLRQLILFAPVGMGHQLGRAQKLADLPMLGDWLMRVLFARSQQQAVAAEATLPTFIPGMGTYQLSQPKTSGYVPAVLSSLRGIIAEPRRDDHLKLARSGLPMLALWGAEDRTIPIAARDVAAGWNPALQHHTVAGAGHGLVYTHTPDLTAAMRAFMAQAGTV